jgi:hypothetical protein
MPSPSSTRERLRPWLLAGGLALAFSAALAVAWAAALARLPQQGATVERLLRAQTGLDVHYASLGFRLGFHGPEAEFTGVELRAPGTGAPLLRAPRMLLRFGTWRLLRGGELRPGHIVISGAEIDGGQLLRPPAAAVPPAVLPPVAHGRRAAEASAPTLAQALIDALGRLPEGSFEFEAATITLRRAAEAAAPAAAAAPGALLALRAPTFYLSRSGAEFTIAGSLLLPARLGRTLFVSADLRASPSAPGRLRGQLLANGRGLQLAGWRDLRGSGLPQFDGTGDLRLIVQLANGAIARSDAEFAFTDVGLGVRSRLAALRGHLGWERGASGEHWLVRDLQLGAARTAVFAQEVPGRIEAQIAAHAGGANWLRADRIPLAALQALLAAGVGLPGPPAPFAASDAGVVQGLLREFALHWNVPDGSPASFAWMGTLSGAGFESAQGDWSLAGAALRFSGSEAGTTILFEPVPVALRAPFLGVQALPVRIAGALRADAAAGSWSVRSDALDVSLQEAGSMRLAGHLQREGAAAPRYRLEAQLAEPLDRAGVARFSEATGIELPEPLWSRLSALEVNEASALLEGVLDPDTGIPRRGSERGTLVLRGMDIAPLGGLPAATALGATLDWDGRGLRGKLTGGRLGDLLVQGGRIAVPGPAAPGREASAQPRDAAVVDVVLAGGVEPALQAFAGRAAWLDAAGPLDARGSARIDARLRFARLDALEPRVDATVSIADAGLRVLPTGGAISDLQGVLSVVRGELASGRLDGRFLEGPVRIRFAPAADGVRVALQGSASAAALERQWGIGLAAADTGRPIDWTADLRSEAGAGARRGLALRTVLAGRARAELHWNESEEAGWHLDRGSVALDGAAVPASVPGAVVVGGRLAHLDLLALGRLAVAHGGRADWQQPVVGEITVDALQLGAMELGNARIRIAGTRGDTRLDLEGPAVAGQVAQSRREAGRLAAQFSRLDLPALHGLAALPAQLAALPARLDLRVTALALEGRPLGSFSASLRGDGAVLESDSLRLTGGTRDVEAQLRCSAIAQGCVAGVVAIDDDLGAFARDLGYGSALRGRAVRVEADLRWLAGANDDLLAGLQGEFALDASAVGEAPGSASNVAPAAGAVAASPPGKAQTLPLLAPLLAILRERGQGLASAGGATPRDAAAANATEAEFAQLALRVKIVDGTARIVRYAARGESADLSIAGSFDLANGTLDQTARWRPLRAGVVGTFDRLDPGTLLAAALRALRDLAPGRGAGRAPALPVDFLLSGSTDAPEVRSAAPEALE